MTRINLPFHLLIPILCFSWATVFAQEVKLPKTIMEHYAHIPKGYTLVGEAEDSVLVEAFYISKHEVANFEYRIFLMSLLKNGRVEEYNKFVYDSTAWRYTQKFSQEAYVTYYHNHSSYADFPAINISYEAANAYCRWVADTLNRKYKDEYQFEVSLPSRAQWIRAAQGDNRQLYAWGGPFVQNKEGAYLANFRVVPQHQISRDIGDDQPFVIHTDFSLPKDCDMEASYVLTAPVASYWPNSFGIYNMNGNVAEMVLSQGLAFGGSWLNTAYDIRNESYLEFDGPAPYVGFRPVFKVKSLQ